MYYKLRFSNTSSGESSGVKFKTHTFLIEGLQGEQLAVYLRENPKCNRPDSVTGLPMIRSFNAKRHRGDAYCYRSNSIDKLTGLTLWRIISHQEIEKRIMDEYPQLMNSDAGLNRIARMATEELHDIIAGKVAPVVAPAVAPDVAPDQVTPPVAPEATTTPVDEQQSTEGSAPF